MIHGLYGLHLQWGDALCNDSKQHVSSFHQRDGDPPWAVCPPDANPSTSWKRKWENTKRTNKQTNKQPNKQTNKQPTKQTNKQTKKQTNKQRNKAKNINTNTKQWGKRHNEAKRWLVGLITRHYLHFFIVYICQMALPSTLLTFTHLKRPQAAGVKLSPKVRNMFEDMAVELGMKSGSNTLNWKTECQQLFATDWCPNLLGSSCPLLDEWQGWNLNGEAWELAIWILVKLRLRQSCFFSTSCPPPLCLLSWPS